MKMDAFLQVLLPLMSDVRNLFFTSLEYTESELNTADKVNHIDKEINQYEHELWTW